MNFWVLIERAFGFGKNGAGLRRMFTDGIGNLQFHPCCELISFNLNCFVIY